MKKFFIHFIICITCGCISHTLRGQKLVLNILNTDKRPIESAMVYEKELSSELSDSNGRVVLFYPLNKKELNLKIYALGFENFDTLIYTSSQEVDITLKKSNLLQEVEIVSFKTNRKNTSTILALSQIKNTPVLLGEPDIFKSLQTLAGINFGVEGSSDIVVRGGGVGENQVLIDGFPSYVSSHLLGLVSPMDVSMVKNVHIFKGGFPARYGGKLSSVIDIETNDFLDSKDALSLRTGVLSNSLFFSKKLQKNINFTFSGRRTLMDLIAKGGYKLLSTQDQTIPYFFDIFSKLSIKINKNNFIDLGIVQNQNYVIEKNTRIDDSYFNKNSWTTPLYYLNYRFTTQNLNIVLGASKTKYNFIFLDKSELLKNGINEITQYQNYSHFNDKILLKIDGNSRISKNLLFSFGANLDNGIHQYKLNRNFVVDSFSVSANFLRNYLSLNFNFTNLKVDAGLNALTILKGNSKTYFEPRLYLEYELNNSNKIFSSFSTSHQTELLASNRSLGNYLKIWVPAYQSILPSKALEYSLGYTKLDKNYEVTLEIFNKYRSNLTHQREGDLVFITSNNFKKLLNNGKGRSFGLELSSKINLTRKTIINGAYTWSKSNIQFEGLNDSKVFPDYFDRRHSIYLGVSYNLNDKWVTNTGFTYNSGQPFTYLNGIYPTAGYNRDKKSFNTTTGTLPSSTILNFNGLNNRRMPVYHRLDITMTKRLKVWSKDAQFSFGIYNIYARTNPLFIRPKTNYEIIWKDNKGIPTVANLKYEIVSYFNFIPFVSLNIDLIK